MFASRTQQEADHVPYGFELSLGRMLLQQAPAVEPGRPAGSGRREDYEHMVMRNRKSVGNRRPCSSTNAHARQYIHELQLSSSMVVLAWYSIQIKLMCEYRPNGSVRMLTASPRNVLVVLMLLRMRLRLPFRWYPLRLRCRWPWAGCASCWRCCCGVSAGRPAPWRCRCGRLGPAPKRRFCVLTSRQAH